MTTPVIRRRTRRAYDPGFQRHSSLLVWFKNSSLDGYAVGAEVTQWDDSSPHGRHATRARTIGPTLATQVQGKRGIAGAGVTSALDRRLVTVPFQIASPTGEHTAILVATDLRSTFGTNSGMWSTYSVATGFTTANSYSRHYAPTTAGTYTVGTINSTSGQNTFAQSSILSTTERRLITAKRVAGVGVVIRAIRPDGTVIGGEVAGTGTLNATSPTIALALLGYNNITTANQANGGHYHLEEFQLYGAALTDAQLKAHERELMERLGGFTIPTGW